MAQYPDFLQIVSCEEHIVVPQGVLYRRHSYDLDFFKRGPRKWLPNTRMPLQEPTGPYCVVFLTECTCWEMRSRCYRCKRAGHPVLCATTAPIIVDAAQKWQPRRCVPQTVKDLIRTRNRKYQRDTLDLRRRYWKVCDGRGPVKIIRKIRERIDMLADPSLSEAMRIELEAAQVRDFDLLEQAISRRTQRHLIQGE